MKILIYAHAFAPKIGGVESNLMFLATGLARACKQKDTPDLQITLATPTPAGNWDDATLPFRVVRQPGFVSLVKLVRNADVIHMAGPCLLPMLLAIFLHRPFMVKHHGYQAICPNGLLLLEPVKTACPGHFMAHRYSKCLACRAPGESWLHSLTQLLATFARLWACRHATCNVGVTGHVKERHGLPRSKVIYHGIPDSLGGANSAIEPPSPTAARTFAYLGRLVSEKGLHVLLGATKKLDEQGYDLHLKFIGDGPERASLQEGVDKFDLGDRVTFTGYLQGKELEDALADVGAMVMPSIWEETAGLSAIEQMMRGRLVIASDFGGVGELVGDAGMKFPVADCDGLTECMKRVLDQPSLVQDLGQKARQRALQFFLQERMVADHISLYRELAAA